MMALALVAVAVVLGHSHDGTSKTPRRWNCLMTVYIPHEVMTVESKTLFIATLVGLAHIVSGVSVIVEPLALNVTPLASLHHLAIYLGYGSTPAGVILLIAGIMAVLGGQLKLALPKAAHVLLFVPQEILLWLTVLTISTALIYGAYPDGYIPQGGAWFILTDQIWTWILAVSHSIYLAVFIFGGFIRGTGRIT